MRRVVFVFFCVLLPLSARADAPDSFGVQARAAAMGGAGTATVEGGLAAYYNPAAVWTPERHLVLGILAAETTFADSDEIVVAYASGNPIVGNVSNTTETVAGFYLANTIPFGKRVSLGVLLYHPFQRTLRVQSQDPFIPTYALYDNRQQRLTLNASIGANLGNGIQLGVGTSILAMSEFTQKLNVPAGREDESATSGFLGFDIVPRATPTAGARLARGDFVFGATFRGPLKLPVSIDAEQGADVVVAAGPSFNFRTRVVVAGTIPLIEHYTPMQIAVGVAWDRETSPIAFALDATFMQWSQYEAPYLDPDFEPLILPPLGELEVNWRSPPPAKFRDTVVVRGGAEWRFQSVAIRGGYWFEPTPVPAQTSDTNILDASKHVFTGGAGVTFPAPFSVTETPFALDVHAQYHALIPQTFEKDVQFNCDDVRDAPPVGYPCAGEITVGGNVLSGGATLTMRF